MQKLLVPSPQTAWIVETGFIPSSTNSYEFRNKCGVLPRDLFLFHPTPAINFNGTIITIFSKVVFNFLLTESHLARTKITSMNFDWQMDFKFVCWQSISILEFLKYLLENEDSILQRLWVAIPTNYLGIDFFCKSENLTLNFEVTPNSRF